MPRAARVVVPGCPHHVSQRGNNRRDVFFVDGDRRVYLRTLRDYGEEFGLAVEGYCLMTNHVHLVVVPVGEDSLARALGRTNQLYTQYINWLHRRSGHLWQDRFFSCPLDEEHFWRALVYVERNPVRARQVRRAWRWPWSSAAAHCDGHDPTGLLDLRRWTARIDPAEWRDGLTQPQDEQILGKLRLSTTRGRPLGSDSFVSKLERLVGRRLRALPHGRPRKARPRRKK